jgi:hypothetical protein
LVDCAPDDEDQLQDVAPEGNYGFIGFTGLEYAEEEDGASARREAIVNGLAARNIRRPN